MNFRNVLPALLSFAGCLFWCWNTKPPEATSGRNLKYVQHRDKTSPRYMFDALSALNHKKGPQHLFGRPPPLIPPPDRKVGFMNNPLPINTPPSPPEATSGRLTAAVRACHSRSSSAAWACRLGGRSTRRARAPGYTRNCICTCTWLITCTHTCACMCLGLGLGLGLGLCLPAFGRGSGLLLFVLFVLFFASFFHESCWGEIAALLRCPRLSWSRLEAANTRDCLSDSDLDRFYEADIAKPLNVDALVSDVLT